MKIIQLLPTLAYGDAVGNDAIALHYYFLKQGYEAKIYAENIDSRIKNSIVDRCEFLPCLDQDDILFYHFSTGSKSMKDILQNCPCRKVMIYHNITPGHYFTEYNPELADLVNDGREELRCLKDIFECCLADSEYNKQDLIREGYTCPIAVLPILIPFKDYEKLPDKTILEQYDNDDITNILFTGRISPNKKQEDIIAAFAYYYKYFNSNSRLFFVGNDLGMESYSDRLKQYVQMLGLERQVVFTGHVPFSQVLAYYRLADVFLCMSDHEGFCVPLIEAMYFNIPILAYNAAAVPETLGDAGIVVGERDPLLFALLLDRIKKDDSLKNLLKTKMTERLKEFSYEKIVGIIETVFLKIVSLNRVTENLSTKEVESINNFDVSFYKDVIEDTKQVRSEFVETIKIVKFETIPLPKRKLRSKTQLGSSVKLFIKKALKKIYRLISLFSPELAVFIREHIYKCWHFLKKAEESSSNNRLVRENPSTLVRENPSILIDVTQTTKVDVGTGIQRVVNNIFLQIYNHHKNDIVAIRDNYGQLMTSYNYLNRIRGIKEDEPDKMVGILKDDKFLLLDSSWEYAKGFSHILNVVKDSGAHSFAVIYDMFPVQYPELFDSPAFVAIFCNWHNMILQKADSILCISRTTADVVAQYYEKSQFKRDYPLNLYYFHMGADVPGGVQTARKEIQDFVKEGKVFLMVGTLEPRKGHMVVLKAFRKLLKESKQDCRLLMIGHNGWKNDAILKQIASPEYESKVLWVQDATDEELRWAYTNADALIAASKDEGFGLPLVEAAHFGLPIICSDIPIFREVTQGNADYFKVMDADDLANCIASWLDTNNHPDSSRIHIYTWEESANEIYDIIEGRVKPYKILN